MINEETKENQSVGLGVNAFEPVKENPNTEGLEDNEVLFGKPEHYDYSGVKLPDNYCYDENLLNEFNELAARYNLSQKGADNLMSLAVKLTQLNGDNFSKTMAEQQRQQINEYKKALMTDREMGGANYTKTLNAANTAYTRFTDNEVRKILQDTGLNCHPKIIKMFYDIGKQMQNDTVYGMGSAVLPKENREDILFPTMQ